MKSSTICLLEIFILAGVERKKHLQFIKRQGESAGIGEGGHSHRDCHVHKDSVDLWGVMMAKTQQKVIRK